MDRISDETRGDGRIALDDAALMHSLARRTPPRGRARLGLSRREARRLSVLQIFAGRTDCHTGDVGHRFAMTTGRLGRKIAYVSA